MVNSAFVFYAERARHEVRIAKKRANCNKRDLTLRGPHVKGKPFIWSESLWDWQPLRDVPDRLDGRFTLMPLYLR